MISYSAATSVCGGGNQGERALDLLQDMWLESLEPDVISYGAGISAMHRMALDCVRGGSKNPA